MAMFGGGDSSLEIVVGARDEASRVLSQVTDNVQRAGEKMQEAGRNMTRNVTAPIVAMGGAAIKSSADFEDSMGKIRVQANLTDEEFQLVKESIKEIGTETGEPFRDIFDAMTLAQSSALDTEEAIDLVSQTAEASASGFGDMESMTNLATTMMLKFGEEGMEIGDVLDTVIGTADQVQAQMDEFVPAFLEGSGSMEQMNVDMDEGAALFGMLADASTTTTKAGTEFQALLSALAKPTEKLSGLITKNFGSMKNFREEMDQNATKALFDLDEAMQNSDSTMSELLGRREAVRGASNLFASTEEDVARVMENAADKTDTVSKKFEESESFVRLLKKAWNELKVAVMPLGDILIEQIAPVLAKVIDKITELSEKFESLEPKQQKIIIAAVGLAAALGPVLIAMGVLISLVGTAVGGLGSLVGPTGAVVAALAALAPRIYENREAIIQFVQGSLEKLRKKWPKIKTQLQVFMNLLKNLALRAKKGLMPVAESMVKSLEDLGKATRKWWDIVKPYLIPALKTVAAILGGTLYYAIVGTIGLIMKLIDWIAEFGEFILSTLNKSAKGWSQFGDRLGKVIDWIGEKWDILWDGVDEIANIAGEKIEKGWKGTINFLIGLAEGFANLWVKAINKVIESMNRLSVSVPDWVPDIGGKSWGVNLSKVEEVKLPKLHTGGTVPGPKGKEVPILAKGQEQVLSTANSQSGGQVNNFYFKNITITKSEDVREIRKQFEKAMRSVSINTKFNTK